MATLLFHPRMGEQLKLNAQVTFNPLLQSRFPAFLEHAPSHGTDDRGGHGLVPWYTTHSTESLRQWPERPPPRDRNPMGREPAFIVETKKIDPQRHAAYKQKEASWRRMIPCHPPPRELQMYYEHQPFREPRYGQLDPATGLITSTRPAQPRHLHPRWLTFGFLHDAIASAWCDGTPLSARVVQLDFTFENDVRPGTRDNRDFIAREALRTKLPEKIVGGPDRLLVLLQSSHRGNGPKRYREAFLDDGSSDSILQWDEVYSTTHPVPRNHIDGEPMKLGLGAVRSTSPL